MAQQESSKINLSCCELIAQCRLIGSLLNVLAFARVFYMKFKRPGSQRLENISLTRPQNPRGYGSTVLK